MKKSAWIIIVIVVVALVGGGLILANKNSDNNKTSNTKTTDMSSMKMSNSSGSTNASNSSTGSSTTATATDKVSIKDFAYSPATVTVKVGDTVTWTNDDSVAHTVTTTSGPESFDGTVDPGKTFTHTFTTAGTYKYHCTIHPSMPTATVVVTAS